MCRARARILSSENWGESKKKEKEGGGGAKCSNEFDCLIRKFCAFARLY